MTLPEELLLAARDSSALTYIRSLLVEAAACISKQELAIERLSPFSGKRWDGYTAMAEELGVSRADFKVAFLRALFKP